MLKNVYTKAFLLGLFTVACTLAISFTVRSIVGRPPDHLTITMGAIIPMLITFPIATFVFRQNDRLKQAHLALQVAHERLAEKARRDTMTGLLNRESFMAQLDVSRLSPAGGTMLIVDADHFKRINDDFGHPVGDKALCRIAEAIALSVRKQDLVGRIGGEEFGCFLLGADRQEATRVAQRLRVAVEILDFRVAGEPLPLTVSVGGSLARLGQVLGELLGEADRCLYEAKRLGRNRVIIETGLTIAA